MPQRVGDSALHPRIPRVSSHFFPGRARLWYTVRVTHPAMKTSARLALLLVAGLVLAGCTSKTALNPPPAATVATAWSDKPQSVRDHFLMRDIEDKVEAQFSPFGR